MFGQDRELVGNEIIEAILYFLIFTAVDSIDHIT